MRPPLAKSPALSLSNEEKTEALRRALSSRTFQKSELLIRFLKYVAEREIAGQGNSITEYSIATEALGRPDDFSPEADSSVRSRAHALRRKLEDLYRDELPDEPVRIILPKGGYVPEFAVLQHVSPPEAPVHAPPVPNPGPRVGFLAASFAAGLLVGIAALLGFLSLRDRTGPGGAPPDLLRKAWGPLLDKNTDVLVVVAVPKQLWVRDFSRLTTPRNEKWYPAIEHSPELLRWFYEPNASLPEAPSLLLHPNVGSPLWGDAAGAMGVARTLSAHGVKHQILPERVLKPYALRDRNAVLFGMPEYSPSIRNLLRDTPFTIVFDSESRWEAVLNANPRDGEPPVFRRTSNNENLGLISVFSTNDGDGKPARTVVFSGLTSAGAQAAEEYFTSAARLAELSDRFKAEKRSAWPGSYQVVVHATTDTNLPIKSTYKAHRVISQ